MSKKRLLQFGVALTIGLLLVLGPISCTNDNSQRKHVSIGAVLPLTGPIAQYGIYMKEGIELALDDAVKEGIIGKDDVRLIIEDGEADPSKSVAAFQKIINTDKPVGVIPATSGVILATKPIANREHIVLINASAISPDIENDDDYCFSVIPLATIEGAFLADFAFKNNKRKAGVLYRNDASGKAFRDVFKQRFEEQGGTLVYEDANQPNETDFRPFINRIAGIKDMDVLFIASFGPEVATYLKQANELGVQRQVLAYTTFNSPKVLEIAGSAANGVFFSAPAFDAASNDPIAKDLRDKVLAKYGQKEINYYVASHYDAMMLLLTAINKGNRDGESIRRYLAALDTYPGKSGTIKFGANGTATIPLRIYTVTDGHFVPYE